MSQSTHHPHRQDVPSPDPPRPQNPPGSGAAEEKRPADSVKDTNVVRGDDRPQSVRQGG